MLRPIAVLLAVSIASCASPYERDVEGHFRHHANSAELERIKRDDAQAQAERRCGGSVELVSGKEALDAGDYRCVPPPTPPGDAD